MLARARGSMSCRWSRLRGDHAGRDVGPPPTAGTPRTYRCALLGTTAFPKMGYLQATEAGGEGATCQGTGKRSRLVDSRQCERLPLVRRRSRVQEERGPGHPATPPRSPPASPDPPPVYSSWAWAAPLASACGSPSSACSPTPAAGQSGVQQDLDFEVLGCVVHLRSPVAEALLTSPAIGDTLVDALRFTRSGHASLSGIRNDGETEYHVAMHPAEFLGRTMELLARRRNERHARGEVAERLKAHAWKACLGETLTRVRIPPSPPSLISI